MRKFLFSKKVLLFFDLLLLTVLVFADQAIKHLVLTALTEKGSIVLIEGILQLTCLKNTGGIFGFLQNQNAFLLFMALILFLLLFYLLTRLPDKPKFVILHPVLSCMLAGALGNLTDRLRFGYVIDFIYFIGIDFPIFNGSDVLISVSVLVLLGLLLFYYKEKDLEFLTFKQKRYRELK